MCVRSTWTIVTGWCHRLVTKPYQHLHPYIDQHLLSSTYTLHMVSVFGGYICHVMSVTLPNC